MNYNLNPGLSGSPYSSTEHQPCTTPAGSTLSGRTMHGGKFPSPKSNSTRSSKQNPVACWRFRVTVGLPSFSCYWRFASQQPTRRPPSLVEPRNRRQACEMPCYHTLTRLPSYLVKLQLPVAASRDLWRMILWSMVTSSDFSAYYRTKTPVYRDHSS